MTDTTDTTPRNRRHARTATPAADPTPTTASAAPAADVPTPASLLTAAAPHGPAAVVAALASLSADVRPSARAALLGDPSVIGAVAPLLADPAVSDAWTTFATGRTVTDPGRTAAIARGAVLALAALVIDAHDYGDAAPADDPDVVAMVDRMLTAAAKRTGGASGPRQVIGRQHTVLIGRTLTLTHAGKAVTATVVADADNARTGVAVRIGRQTFRSVSAAARSVVGASANGWAVWSTTVDGKSGSIGDLYDEGALA